MTMNDMKELGRRLSFFRQNHELTQSNVAEYLNVDQSLISKIEKGERNIDSVSLEALADLYLVTVEDLIDGKDDELLKVSFRRDDCDKEDLFCIARINRIVLNQLFMDGLEKEDENR